jgi:hypothetical protein
MTRPTVVSVAWEASPAGSSETPAACARRSQTEPSRRGARRSRPRTSAGRAADRRPRAPSHVRPPARHARDECLGGGGRGHKGRGRGSNGPRCPRSAFGRVYVAAPARPTSGRTTTAAIERTLVCVTPYSYRSARRQSALTSTRQLQRKSGSPSRSRRSSLSALRGGESPFIQPFDVRSDLETDRFDDG